jgi:hypothetical protein
MVAAVGFDLFQVACLKREDTTLLEMFAVNLARVLALDFIEKRTTDQDHTAGAAAITVALAAGQHLFVVLRIDVCPDIPPDLPLQLQQAKPECADRRTVVEYVEDWKLQWTTSFGGRTSGEIF